jgi:N-acetylglutamate synthase-like GNAT family acetyltransferase
MTYQISEDRSRLNQEWIHEVLRHSYWAEAIPWATLEKSIEHSMCFGVYATTGEQIGFARVITDKATFAYLCDVIIDEKMRGQGIGKALMQYVFAHEDLQGLRRFTLATRDAHGLYEKYGFTAVKDPSRLMEIVHRDLYVRQARGEI